MKLCKLFLILCLTAEADVLHFKYEGLKKSYKGFRDSNTFLQNKYSSIQEELQKEALLLEEEERKLGDKATESDRTALQNKFDKLQNKSMVQQEDMKKTAELIEEQNKEEVVKAAKTITGTNVLIENNIILYGGTDITKDLLSSLNEKDVTIKSNKDNLKIGYVDSIQFINQSKDAQKSKKFFEDKVAKLQKRQKELIGSQDSKDFDPESAQRELQSLNDDAMRAQQLMIDKINSSILNAASIVAEKEKIDLIIDKKLIFGGGIDLTANVIAESKLDNKFEGKSTSKALSINWDIVISGYIKAQDMLKAQENQRDNISKELESKYNNIQKMRDDNKSEKEISKAEEEFGRERYQRVQMLKESTKKSEETIINNIKSMAKTIASKKGAPLMVINGEFNSGVFYPGKDISLEILKALNGHK